MPMFYFHFLTGDARDEDKIGLDLPHAEEAYRQAIDAAKGMASSLMAEGINPATCSFEIANDDGWMLFVVAFTELFGADRRASLRSI